MVSWESDDINTTMVAARFNEPDGSRIRESTGTTVVRERNEGMSVPSHFRLDLITFARYCITDDDYHLLKEHIRNPSLNVIGGVSAAAATEEDNQAVVDDVLSTLLHATILSKGDIPLDLIQCIVEAGGLDMMSIQDYDGMTPLHLVTSEIPWRTDIVEYLVQKAPEAAGKRNKMLLRPIDLISHKIIMLEETLKYVADKDSQEAELEQMWETVLCLVKASSVASFQQPMLHTSLMSDDFPFSLMQRAIQRYSNQLSIPNRQGDLPLHLVVRRPPVENDSLDDVGDLFVLILKRYVEAATTLNQKGLSPLTVAINNGYRWQSKVLRTFVIETPLSIGTLSIPSLVLPFLLERLVRETTYLTAAFVVLRARAPVECRCI
jgi:hypothetical protein